MKNLASSAILSAAVSGILFALPAAAGGSPGPAGGSAGFDDPTASALGDTPDAGGKHACKGQNACKGQGGCKTDKHACKGQNACKGQGGCRTDGKK
ncbi:MAG: hypothetical protein WBY94_04855 [Polyangiaceae bacterium]